MRSNSLTTYTPPRAHRASVTRTGGSESPLELPNGVGTLRHVQTLDGLLDSVLVTPHRVLAPTPVDVGHVADVGDGSLLQGGVSIGRNRMHRVLKDVEHGQSTLLERVLRTTVRVGLVLTDDVVATLALSGTAPRARLGDGRLARTVGALHLGAGPLLGSHFSGLSVWVHVNWKSQITILEL